MAGLLPIFPLGLVAFPGMAVPLHIFEERYRTLVRDLLAQPDPAQRLLGIVAIREGYEVGSHESHSMYRTGCVMQLTSHEEYDDGRFDVVVVGRHRMRVLSTVVGGPDGAYLRAEVEHLEPPAMGPQAAVGVARAAAHALAVFEDYRTAVSRVSGGEVMTGGLPREPELLSYALAAGCALTLRDRQSLLESPGTRERLDLLRRLLKAELRHMRAVPSLPATEVARVGWGPN